MAECSSSPLAVSILPGLDSKEIDALFSVVQPAAEFDRLPRLLAARNPVDRLSLLLGCRRLLHPPLHHRASSPPPYAVDLIPFITAEIPDLSTTAQALKILDSCGSDIIELGVPYSDPLADGPVIQAATTHSLAKETNFDSVIVMLKEAAATRSLAKCTNFDSVIAMLKKVIPQLSCPIGLFTYYNPILVWRGEIHDNFERYWNPL